MCVHLILSESSILILSVRLYYPGLGLLLAPPTLLPTSPSPLGMLQPHSLRPLKTAA